MEARHLTSEWYLSLLHQQLDSISCVCGMSSQGQALPALASPTSPPTLLSCPHLLPPAVFLPTLSLPPPCSGHCVAFP